VIDGVNGLTPIISTGIPVRNKGFEMSGNIGINRNGR
jgi:hypothetical protein